MRRGIAIAESLECRRLLSFGDLEPQFGEGDGVVIDNFLSQGRDVVVQRDNKIILICGGEADRYFPNGTFDPSYNGGVANFSGTGLGGALQADGKLVIASQISGGIFSSHPSVARITTSGVLDTTFGGTGQVDVGATFESIRDVAI